MNEDAADLRTPGPESPAPITLSAVGAWGVAFVLTGVLYGVTMAPGILWGDSGEAQLHVYLGGWMLTDEIARSHVLYYALARGVNAVLPGGPAWCSNLTTALMGTLTVANVAGLIAVLTRRASAVWVGAGMLAVAHTFWQLAAGAEVATTTTCLLTTELVFFLQAARTRQPIWLLLALLANGLGVSNHNFALLTWPVYVVAGWRWRSWWWPRRGLVLVGGAVAVLVGMLPVLALVVEDLLAHGDLPATAQSFLFGRYGGRVANLGALPGLVARSVAALVLNFPTPVLLLAIPGIGVLRRRAPAPMVWLVIGALLVHAGFAVRYNVPDQHTFLVPTFVLIALLAGLGMAWWMDNAKRRRWRVVVMLAAVVSPAFYAVAPAALRQIMPNLQAIPQREVPHRDPYDWFLQPWRTGCDGPERFARETIALLPPDAWLVIDSTVTSPINYVQAIENRRRDIRLDNWVAHQPWLAPLSGEELTAAREAKLQAGLLYAMAVDSRYAPPWLRAWDDAGRLRVEPVGHLFHVLPAEPTP